MVSPYTLANEVFRTYGFYAIVMALKMFAIAFLISYYRLSKKVFGHIDDKTLKHSPRTGPDEATEIARRVNINDMENIIPFWIIGLLYVSTNPSLSTATFCYRTFAIARIVHTFVHIFGVPQPCRALAFTGGMLINIFMAFQVLYAFA